MLCELLFLQLLATICLLNDEEINYKVKISNKPIIDVYNYPPDSIRIERFNNASYLCKLPATVEKKKHDTPIERPQELLRSHYGLCLEYATKMYWNFSICFGKNVTQYHRDVDGVIRGKNYFLLGHFSKEKDWNLTELQSTEERLYHTQSYTNGQECRHNLRRSAELRLSCGMQKETTVVSYFEQVDCKYVFIIAAPVLCSIPAFRSPDRTDVKTIHCHPLVTLSKYRDYYLPLERLLKSTRLREFIKLDGAPIFGQNTIIHLTTDQDNPAMNSAPVSLMNNLVFDESDLFLTDDKPSDVMFNAIVEKEDGEPVFKWRFSYSKKVDFKKLLSRAVLVRATATMNEQSDLVTPGVLELIKSEISVKDPPQSSN